MKPKILSVRLDHKQDEFPDTSWLGEYSDQPSGWYLDRITGVLFEDDGTKLAEGVPADYNRGEYAYITSFQHDGSLSSWKHVSDSEVEEAWLRCRYRANGNEQGLRGNLFEHFGVIGWQRAMSRAEKVKMVDVVYACLNCYRLYRLERQDWCFIGIIAKAEVQIGSTVQTIRSGGFWGIESDSGNQYLSDVEREQLDELREQLSSLGIGKRAIDYAFKRVERTTL